MVKRKINNKNNTINLLVIGIFILISFSYVSHNKQSDFETKVNYYDKDGNIIDSDVNSLGNSFNIQSLSDLINANNIISDVNIIPSNTVEVGFDIKLTNTGNSGIFMFLQFSRSNWQNTQWNALQNVGDEFTIPKTINTFIGSNINNSYLSIRRSITVPDTEKTRIKIVDLDNNKEQNITIRVLAKTTLNETYQVQQDFVWRFKKTEISSECFQESATIVNQNGKDGNCDLTYNGNYSYGGDSPPSFFDTSIKERILWDGDWSSAFWPYSSSANFIFYVTYSIPNNSNFNYNGNKAIYKTWGNPIHGYNVETMDLPSECIFDNNVKLLYKRTGAKLFSPSMKLYCFTGLDFEFIGDVNADANGMFEEGILWNINKTITGNDCLKDSDCVRNTCCHPNDSVPSIMGPTCVTTFCSNECLPNTLDCSQSEPACINGFCKVRWN